MSLQIWAAFVVAAGVILVIPGPTIIFVISQAAVHGRKAVLPLVLGVTLGDLTAMTFSLLGLGALLLASAALFSILKWIGAAYLIYLGIRLWRDDPNHANIKDTALERSGWSLSKSAFIITALNPKSIIFFIAFLPQFVNPGENPGPQLLILGATFLFLGSINSALYGYFSGSVRQALRTSRTGRWFNRAGASALIGAGLFTAVVKKSG